MIRFISVDKLKPGMTLARDIYGVDTFTAHVVMLKAGQKLTIAHITRLLNLDLQGVYISETPIQTNLLNTETKQEALSRVKEIYDISQKASETLYAGSISNANDILEKLIDTILKSENMYIDVDSLRLYDDCTYNHSLGVTVLSIAIGNKLHIARKDLSDLATCALLHDIGKMQIPVEIIQKPSRLTKDELNLIKEHPRKGYDMLYGKKLASEAVLNGILSHHERLDGTGYPNKALGKQIPLFGRIVACADVYDALTANRPYRTPSQPSEVIEYIMGSSGKQFDHDVVCAFKKCVSPYPIGCCVKLSNGETAIVAAQNESNPLRPILFLMDDPTVMINLCTDKKFFNVVISSTVESK